MNTNELRTACIAACLFLFAGFSTAQTIEENGGGPGWLYDWDEESIECEGTDPLDCNVLTPDFPTALIECAPAHWGPESIVLHTRLAQREALVRKFFDTPIDKAWVTLEFAILLDDVEVDKTTMIASAKDGHWTVPAEKPAWVLRLVGCEGPLHRVRIEIGGKLFQDFFVPTREVHKVEILPSRRDMVGAAWWDGDFLGGVPLDPDSAGKIKAAIIGNSGSSTGAGSIVAINQFLFRAID